MAIRNFWIEARIDGRKTLLKGGPRRKDEGFKATIYIRNKGGVETACFISGNALEDGTLLVRVEDKYGKTALFVEAVR